MHNLMLEDSTPGAVHLSVAAVPPLHPTISGILKKALPLALGGLLLGLLAASIANYLDPKVYIGADIEQVLGFAPMAVLPDFDEVSNEVSAEHLLRLSSAIEHARKQGDLNSCIFTGTAAGVGVTTLATRVRDVLEAMGRPTVLLDSSGTPPAASRAGSQNSAPDQHAAQRGSRSTALLRKVAAETETRQESLVLTDTAPLLISAETEYLARFVDCAIVVVESGTSTRAQLLAALNSLQRLDVGAVGFVLNRVKLDKADPAFRHSVQEIEKHHQAQSMSTSRRTESRRTERTSQVAEELLPDPKELPRESSVADDSAPVASESGNHGPAARQSTAVAPRQAAPKWVMAAPVKPWSPRPAEPEDGDTPWWLSDAQASPPAPPAKTERPREPHPPVQPKPAQPKVESQGSTKSLTSWENASGWSDDFTPLKIAKAAPVAAAEAAPRYTKEVAPIARVASMPVAEAAPRYKKEVAPIAVERVEPMPLAEVAPKYSKETAPVAVERVEPMPVAEAAPRYVAEVAPAVVAEAAPVAEVVPEEVHREREEVPIEPPSRLNPLRGLLFSLGLRNLGKTRDAAPLEEPSPLPVETEPERTILARSYTPFAEPVLVAAAVVPVVAPEPAAVAAVERAAIVAAEPLPVVTPEAVPVAAPEVAPVAAPIAETKVASVPEREVTTLPEFLPPREFIPVREADDRRGAYDEVQILPSRRGQYKR